MHRSVCSIYLFNISYLKLVLYCSTLSNEVLEMRCNFFPFSFRFHGKATK